MSSICPGEFPPVLAQENLQIQKFFSNSPTRRPVVASNEATNAMYDVDFPSELLFFGRCHACLCLIFQIGSENLSNA